MSSVERLIQKIERDLGIRNLESKNFKRLYPGRNLRAAGAWSWCIGPIGAVGSPWAVKEFLKKDVVIKKIQGDFWKPDIEIVPEEVCSFDE